MQHQCIGAEQATFGKVCAGCGVTRYCSKACQRLHWRGDGTHASHREQCGKFRGHDMSFLFNARDCRAVCEALFFAKQRVRNELVCSGFLAAETWGRGVFLMDFSHACAAWAVHKALVTENMPDMTATSPNVATAPGKFTCDRECTKAPQQPPDEHTVDSPFFFLAKPLVMVSRYCPLGKSREQNLQQQFYPSLLRAVQRYDPSRQVVLCCTMPPEFVSHEGDVDAVSTTHVTLTSSFAASVMLTAGVHRTVWIPDLEMAYAHRSAASKDRNVAYRIMREHRRAVVTKIVSMAAAVLSATWSRHDVDDWFRASECINTAYGQTVVLPNCTCSACTSVTLKLHLRPPATFPARNSE